MIVSDEAEPVAGLGVSVAVAPAGSGDTAGVGKLTAAVVLTRVIETAELVAAPCATACADGLTDSPKFAAFWLTTASVSVAVCVSDPLLAETVGL